MTKAQIAEVERHLKLIEASAKLLALDEYLATDDPKLKELALKVREIGKR